MSENMRDMRLVLAGFGGQGVLFAGKVVATCALLEDREVSWLPSYGPEMRGGTANCSVTLSDEPIGSPLVCAPDALVAMNQPSFDKFISEMSQGGVCVVDTTLVLDTSAASSADVRLCALPAAAMAEEADLKGLGNIVLVGKLWAETRFCERATLDAAIDHCVPARKAAMVEKNKRALALGIEG